MRDPELNGRNLAWWPQREAGTIWARQAYCGHVRRSAVFVGLTSMAILLPIVAWAALALRAAPERGAEARRHSAPRPALEAATAPIIPCKTRSEPSVAGFQRKRDIVRGPFALITIRRDLPRLSRRSYRPRGGRLPDIKLPVGLRTAHEATLRVAAHQRTHAALIYRDATRHAEKIDDGDTAVTFKPCPADTPSFAGGNVGPITGWAGALITTGPGCVQLELLIDGRRRPDIRLPLGRRCR